MADVPLPKVDYDAGWHRQYTADQMHAHAAAVSAAKDAEIAGLRAELFKSLADNAPLRERVKVLEDALRHIDKECFSHVVDISCFGVTVTTSTTQPEQLVCIPIAMAINKK